MHRFFTALITRSMFLALMLATASFSNRAMSDASFLGQKFSYFGRLPSSYESATRINLEVSFFETEGGNDVLSRVPRIYKDLPLQSGAFELKIEMDQHEFESVFRMPPRPAYIEIRDTDRNVTFRRQAFLPRLDTIEPEPAKEAGIPFSKVASVSILDSAQSACMATQTAGAKFVVEIRDLSATCEHACVHTETRSSCIRGWTVFIGGSQFEFGNECHRSPGGFSTPVASRICCCVTTVRPMPNVIDSRHH